MIQNRRRFERPQGFERIVGSSNALGRVLDQIKTVALTDSTVLIEGETGTGKELIAGAIHAQSRRRDRPFVKFNCAAIPLGRLESELFGHERGAFTGAVRQKLGRFEAAHGGTLFLDEIGDIPPELQPKPLRVLQEQSFERLGSSHTSCVDLRVVAAIIREWSTLEPGSLYIDSFPKATSPETKLKKAPCGYFVTVNTEFVHHSHELAVVRFQGGSGVFRRPRQPEFEPRQ